MFVLPRKWCFQSIISDMLAGRKGPDVTGGKNGFFCPLSPPPMYHSINITFKLQSFEALAYIGLKCHLTAIHETSILKIGRPLSGYFCRCCPHFYRGSLLSVQSHLCWPVPLNPKKPRSHPNTNIGESNRIAD